MEQRREALVSWSEKARTNIVYGGSSSARGKMGGGRQVWEKMVGREQLFEGTKRNGTERNGMERPFARRERRIRRQSAVVATVK